MVYNLSWFYGVTVSQVVYHFWTNDKYDTLLYIFLKYIKPGIKNLSSIFEYTFITPWCPAIKLE